MNAQSKLSGLVVFFLCCAPAAAQDTFQLDGTTSKLDNGKYVRMPNVQFSVLRKGPVLPAPLQSDAKGVFQVEVPAGDPVTVVFWGPGNNYLPQLQALSGEAGCRHDVQVTLMTINQARDKGIDPIKHVSAVLEYLSANGVNEDDPAWKAAQAVRERAG